MLKRLFWLTLGIAIGLGSSLWVLRTVRRTVDRYSADRLRQDLAKRLEELRGELRAAAVEGREAMRQREAALRSELEHRR